jgi:leader peptidase (prepilin peptidase)/N-methyltransferase
MSPLLDGLHAVPDGVWVGFALALGLCVGSFLNVVIHRLPRDESIVRPSSHCPSCLTPLRWFDNLPLASYLWLRGRCRGCGGRISLRYPLIELVTGLLFAAVALRFGATPMTLVGCAFAAALVATAAIDFDHQIIPDEISLGGLAVALFAVPATAWLEGQMLGAAVVRSLAGALLGGGMLWIVGFLHARVSAAAGRRFAHWPGDGEALPRFGSLDYWTWFPGVGFGDVKLLAMIGAVLGPVGVLETIVLASLAGLVVGALVTLSHRTWNTPFGFAPAIAVGALLALLGPDPFAWLPLLK